MTRNLKFLWAVISLIPVLFASCVSEPDAWASLTPDPTEVPQRPQDYYIEDFKGKAEGESIPEWVILYIESGLQGIETLEIYQFDYVFVSRNVGTNFNALNHWLEGFSTDLDFPGLAAARIEERFLLAAPLPDREYGPFFIELIRAASDAVWTGATREDNFWMLKRSGPDEALSWEFLILTAIPKPIFASQFDAVFSRVSPRPPPSWEQLRAAARVRQNFFEGF